MRLIQTGPIRWILLPGMFELGEQKSTECSRDRLLDSLRGKFDADRAPESLFNERLPKRFLRIDRSPTVLRPKSNSKSERDHLAHH